MMGKKHAPEWPESGKKLIGFSEFRGHRALNVEHGRDRFKFGGFDLIRARIVF